MGLTFKTLDVYNRARGGTLIAWTMAAPAPVGITFRVWYSHSGVGDWRYVALVVDGATAVDVERRHYGASLRAAYRVDAEAGDETATRTATVGGMHDRQQQLTAGAILRKEELLLRKKTGTPGLLWKRKHWGARCSCVNPDTGECLDSHCDKCYGTGTDGGYFAAVDYMIALGGQKSRKLDTSDAGAGTVGNVQPQTGRALICPRLDTGDVWANCRTDERYVVGTIQATLFAGVPLLYHAVELNLAPAADVVYALPREGDPEWEAGRLVVENGMLMVYDTSLRGYYPIGLQTKALTVFSAPAVAYRMQDNRLYLLDIDGGIYRPVGLNDGVFEVYDSSDVATDALARVTDGLFMLWDRTLGRYRRCGLADGAFTVYEEPT